MSNNNILLQLHEHDYFKRYFEIFILQELKNVIYLN